MKPSLKKAGDFTVANMVSEHGVCLCGQKLGSAWKILPITARSLWSSFPVCGDKQGRAGVGRSGQPLRGSERGAISIKEILGENRGTCI